MNSKIKTLNPWNFVVDSTLAKDNGQFAFGQAIGSVQDTNLPNEVYGNRALGVHSMKTSLTIGPTHQGFLAPINKAARALYTKYWSKNSSISNFQEMDVMLYTFCSAQCVAALSWLETIYGACFIENPKSLFVREGILRALGVNPNDMHLHVNDLRSYINQKIIDLKQIKLDASIPLYGFAAEMYKYILKDSPNTTKTQYYVKRPGYFIEYNVSGDNIGSADYVLVGDDAMTFDQLTERVDSLFTKFFKSYTMASISAAIEKAGVPVYQMEYLKEDFRVEPIFDEFALLRTKNAVVCQGDLIRGSKITQNVIERTLNCTIEGRIGPTYVPDDYGTDLPEYIANFYKSNPVVHAKSESDATPETVIALASLTTGMDIENRNGTGAVTGEEQQTVYATLKEYGVEVVDQSLVWYIATNSAGKPYITSNNASSFVTVMEADSNLDSVLRAMKCAVEFDFLPNLRLAVCAWGSDEGFAVDATDVDYSRPFTRADLARVHQTAIYAILGVPAE